jgi:hypothetical protein
MENRVLKITTALSTLLVLSAIGLTQTPPRAVPSGTTQSGTLTIVGYTGQAPIFQLNGKYCVELEQLAHLTQASLTFKTNQIVLDLSPSSPPEQAAETKPKSGFSKGFLQAAIEQLGVMREWRGGIKDAIQSSFPLPEDWIAAQRRNAEKSLALVSTAITTDDDKKAYPLLAGEVNLVQRLSDQYIAMRKNLDYMPPDFLDSDPLDQQILGCSHGLAAMASANQFQEEPNCH